MKNQTLDFEHYYQLHFFNVTFDTTGREDNLITSVTMDEGWPICDITLRSSHKELYKQIDAKVKEESNKFWSTYRDSESTKRKAAFDKFPSLTKLSDFFANVKTA